MKLSAILFAKSEIANEIEDKIGNLKREIKSNIDCYDGAELPEWTVEENAKFELKIKYYESILKSVPGLN